MSYQKTIIVGNLGDNPEYSEAANGTKVCRFSLATNEKWTDKASGEKKERVEWHRLVCFNRTAEIAAEYLKKGVQVMVEGKNRTTKWDDDKGITRWTTDIHIDRLVLLSNGGGGGRQPNAPAAEPVGAPDFDDDIPF